MTRPVRYAAVALAVAFLCSLAGCSSAPSRNILGSYFPSWMICALMGLVLAGASRVLFVKTGIEEVLPWPLVVYLALTIAYTFAIWLAWLA